jgi:hypothetical protein
MIARPAPELSRMKRSGLASTGDDVVDSWNDIQRPAPKRSKRKSESTSSWIETFSSFSRSGRRGPMRRRIKRRSTMHFAHFWNENKEDRIFPNCWKTKRSLRPWPSGLGFGPEEAENLRIRSALMVELTRAASRERRAASREFGSYYVNPQNQENGRSKIRIATARDTRIIKQPNGLRRRKYFLDAAAYATVPYAVSVLFMALETCVL